MVTCLVRPGVAVAELHDAMGEAAVGTDEVLADKLHATAQVAAFADDMSHEMAHAPIARGVVAAELIAAQRAFRGFDDLVVHKWSAEHVLDAEAHGFDVRVVVRLVRDKDDRPRSQSQQASRQLKTVAIGQVERGQHQIVRIEHVAIKEAAAELTQIEDGVLEQVMRESRAERQRIQDEAERDLPVASGQ